MQICEVTSNQGTENHKLNRNEYCVTKLCYKKHQQTLHSDLYTILNLFFGTKKKFT